MCKSITPKKEIAAGIRTNMVSLLLESEKNKKQIVFGFPKSAKIMATGIGIKKEDRGTQIYFKLKDDNKILE